MKFNLRNKYLVVTLRTVFGLLFMLSGVSGLWMGTHGLEGVPPDLLPMNQTLWNIGVFEMIKVTETIAGLMLVTGFLPALAVIFLAPIAVGIVIVNALTFPSAVIVGVVICAIEMYFGYVYWDKYKALFMR
jgi:uncharacterized membrane protein YphA (DoxX/SURF4 family)